MNPHGIQGSPTPIAPSPPHFECGARSCVPVASAQCCFPPSAWPLQQVPSSHPPRHVHCSTSTTLSSTCAPMCACAAAAMAVWWPKSCRASSMRCCRRRLGLSFALFRHAGGSGVGRADRALGQPVHRSPRRREADDLRAAGRRGQATGLRHRLDQRAQRRSCERVARQRAVTDCVRCGRAVARVDADGRSARGSSNRP